MKTALLLPLLLALAACGKVQADDKADAGVDANTSALRLEEGRVVTVTVDDGFEQAPWRCAGSTCVQGSIKP